MNKKLYIGKRNYIVDVLLVGGNDLNMAYLSIPPLLTGFKFNLKPVKRGGIDILPNDRNLMCSDSEMHVLLKKKK